ncbi:hypothetical protein GCM10009627_14390 [Curtobacterium herbarum]|uniref:Uncharacterized protein n=1 Tax=Curtobacterium herbarum TaxID=150122 RepID=A0ABP4K4Y2_9MICO
MRSEDRDGVDRDAGQSGDPGRRDAEQEVVAAEPDAGGGEFVDGGTVDEGHAELDEPAAGE